MKLLKTGIAGLDEFLQGGLPPRVFLIVGTPGSGNDVFARQVANYRAKEVDVTYFTVTRSVDSVREDMCAYGWQTQPLEKTGSWRFITLASTDKLTETVTAEMKQHRSIVIDSLSELLLTHKTNEVTDLLNTMSNLNKDCQELHLILLTKGMQPRTTEVAMQHFADGVLVFTTSHGTEAQAKHIMIKKIRAATVPSRMLQYNRRKRLQDRNSNKNNLILQQ